MPFAPLARSDLFARLSAGLAAKLAVVTPNRRLAQDLAREFDAGQAARGLPVWESADILPLSAFVERLYEDALYSGLAPALPLLLTQAQALELWEQAIRASPAGGELLDPSRAAARAPLPLRRLLPAAGAAVAAVERAFPGAPRDGAVDRKALGAKVFGDHAALKRLEAILDAPPGSVARFPA